MKRHLMMLMMGVSALMLAATQIQAAPRNCGPHDAVTSHLAAKYAERREMVGLASNNMMMELYVADSGTWTLIVTRPDGITCLVASGTDAELVSDALENTDPDV